MSSVKHVYTSLASLNRDHDKQKNGLLARQFQDF